MKIVIATPLYPPDIEPTALYIKELSQKLSLKHQITVVLYGKIPERVPGVTLVPVSKYKTLATRMFSFTWALISASRKADIVYIENGSSVEFPALVLQFLFRKKMIVHLGDMKAHEWTQKRMLRKFLENALLKRSHAVVSDMPLPRPEILPFTSFPEEAQKQYEISWQKHITLLEKIFHEISS